MSGLAAGGGSQCKGEHAPDRTLAARTYRTCRCEEVVQNADPVPVCRGQYGAERRAETAGRRADRRGVGMRRIGIATRSRGLIGAAVMVLGAALVAQAGPESAGASTLPAGFRDS